MGYSWFVADAFGYNDKDMETKTLADYMRGRMAILTDMFYGTVIENLEKRSAKWSQLDAYDSPLN